MPDALRERVATTLGSAYDLEAEVGRGGMGVVYRCKDQKLRRHVAIKVLPPDLAFREDVRTRFLREAETAAQLSHPNIVPIYSVDDREGLVWFVMGLVDGESLAARLAREGEARPAVADVRRILCEVADALSYAHSRGIIHRDIKPDNILLDRLTGRPMVTDFGIARAIEGDSRLTVTGIAVGTPAYMSPEQAIGEREIDGRSDLYSLAVVGYQMIVGELPFQANNTPSMLMKHISDPLRSIRSLRPDAQPALAAVVERALAKKPNDRWNDAAEFRDAVAATMNESAHAAEVPGLRPLHDSVAWKRPAVRPPPAPPDAANPPPVRLPRLTDRGSRAAEDAASRRDHVRRSRTPRDAVEAANDGMPPVPAWMPPEWRDARRDWRRHRDDARTRRQSESQEDFSRLSRDAQIRRFRKRAANAAITVTLLAGINLVFTPGFPWFLFPTIGLSLGVMRWAGSLWADGVRLRDVFGREASNRLSAAASEPARARLSGAPSPLEQAEKLAPREVLAGPYGAVVRRAATDRVAAHDALAKLAPPDRALIPDVGPTVDSLAERVGSIAHALHRLDEDVTAEAVEALEREIAATRAQPESTGRDKKLALLERQLATRTDLGSRRETLRAQLDSAALMLQNMRLDLLALRSAGVQSVINDVTSATQEARALSRDIQIALEAAKEIRT